MSRYDAVEDPLCYPGTTVLRNKADIRDQDVLDQFEYLMFETRAEEDLPPGDLDYVHYRAIHHHFFQDVYDWAGEIRQIRTAKDGNRFCHPEYIDTEMEKLFAQLVQEDHLRGIDDLSKFAKRAAHYIAEINAIHPFREGNGRCQLTLFNLLLRASGREFDEDRLVPERFMNAMIASFHGDNSQLALAIEAIIIPAP